MAEDPEWVTSTQQAFAGFLKRPKMSSKLLKKPPFRFLHDIVTNTMKVTGFPEGLFDVDQFDAKAMNKDQKIAFLERLVEGVELAAQQKLTVRAGKIVAGLEPEHTNAMLSVLAETALLVKSGKLDARDVAQKYHAGQRFDPEAAPAPKQQQAKPEPKKPEPKPAKPTPVADDESGEFWEVTQRKLAGLITKPKLKDNLLKRPPFRFIHDIVTNVSRAPGGFLAEGVFQGDELNAKTKDSSTKLSYLDKLIRAVEIAANAKLQVTPKKIAAGMEAEETNKMLQIMADFVRSGSFDMDVVRAKLSQPAEVEEAGERAPSPPARDVRAETEAREQALRAKEHDKQQEQERRAREDKQDKRRKEQQKREEAERRALEQAQEQEAQQQQQQKQKQQMPGRGQPVMAVPGLDLSPLDDQERDTQQQPQSAKPAMLARPMTARGAPPKIRSKVVEKEDKNVRPDSGKEEVHRMILGDGALDEDEDDAPIEDEETALPGFEQNDNGGDDDDDDEPKGKLRREMDEAMGVKKAHKFGRIGGQTKKSSFSDDQVKELREVIQRVCKSTNPLGKCVDFVFEDLDQMNAELGKWKVQWNRQQECMKEERQITQEVLAPLQQRLKDMDAQIAQQVKLVNEKKATLLRNEQTIEKALSNRISVR